MKFLIYQAAIDACSHRLSRLHLQLSTRRPHLSLSLSIGSSTPKAPETVSFICCLILVLCGLARGRHRAARGGGVAACIAIFSLSIVETKEKTHNEIRNCNSGKGQRAKSKGRWRGINLSRALTLPLSLSLLRKYHLKCKRWQSERRQNATLI